MPRIAGDAAPERVDVGKPTENREGTHMARKQRGNGPQDSLGDAGDRPSEAVSNLPGDSGEEAARYGAPDASPDRSSERLDPRDDAALAAMNAGVPTPMSHRGADVMGSDAASPMGGYGDARYGDARYGDGDGMPGDVGDAAATQGAGAMGADATQAGGTGAGQDPVGTAAAAMGVGAGGSGIGGAGMSVGTGGGGAGGGGSTPRDTQPPSRRTCGTMNVHRRLLNTSPEYARARAQIESFTLRRAREVGADQRTGVSRIPVVVHVVWNTAAQNVSEAQIRSQIDVLNRDFRRTNPDVSQTPGVFQALTADAEIEFFLATQDPAGNPTTGITRTQTNATSFIDDDRVKSTATGGANAWPADRYLNMWVCQLGGGLLGYAQFPGGPANTDGVVITHTGFGTTGTAAAPFNLGRTATHEVGHYLNLFHIWGDDGTGCAGSDQVDDTPNQAGPNAGAPTFPHVSCNNGPNGDLFMNYMDYTDDRAMFMFTAGQVARMRACLDGPRAALSIPAVALANRTSGPVVAWGQNRLDVFARGTDFATYHKAWDGAAWRPSPLDWERLGGICTSPPRAVAWGPNRLDIFVTGTDSALYHKAWDGAAWRPSPVDWERLGGICIGQPDVAAWGPNRLDVFVRGTDLATYHKAWDGAAWRPSTLDWERLGGICTSAPRAVAWGPNRLDVFVTGTDGALYHKAWDGAAWRPSPLDWERLGGICVGQPEVVSWGANRLDIFVIGTDAALYHKAWDGAAWRPSPLGWERLGGICTRPPRAVAWGPNRLDVFVTGTDAALYHKAWDGAAWRPSALGWERLGGVCTSAPQVTSWGPNRLDVFVRGTDSALYHKAWDGAAWRPSVLGWERLGGIISDARGVVIPPVALGFPTAVPPAPAPFQRP